MSTPRTLRLATRGSDLALRQASAVADALSSRRLEVELVEVETRGDQLRDELLQELGTVGAFVRALDERVLAGDVDAAVHSMKDVPTDLPGDLDVAGVPDRAPAGDVVVTPDGTALDRLPGGSVVGTSSLRRTAQVLAERPDLTVEPIRGNVETRVEKLLAPGLQAEHERRTDAEEEGDADAFDESLDDWLDGRSRVEQDALGRRVETEYDALVMAEAGLRRIGLFHAVSTERLDRSNATPAAGQGALAVTAVGETAREIHESIDDPVARVATTVERTILGELGGGCVAPIGVNALVQGEVVDVRAQVFDPDPEPGEVPTVVSGSRDLPIDDHADAAVEFAAELADRGAAELVAKAREAGDAGDADRSPDVHADDADGGDDGA